MRPTHALTAVSAAAVVALAAPAAMSWTGDAYADGSVLRTQGTGTASGTVDADSDGNLELTANSAGGTKFLVPILNLLPYSNPTTVNGRALVSDGVEGFPAVEAGNDYLVTVTYSDLDLESSQEGNGDAVAAVWAQASAGVDGAGHTLVAGSGTEVVTEDGATVLEFEFHATQDSAVGVRAAISVLTTANGEGNEASAELNGVVTDVEIIEID
ncbi:MAG: hypothetical protein M3520_04265 [Actinomycetota bacterium]|jgi:hypothetical protein|nr:hypothetical protein [Actinomycetota bacterium]